MFKYFFTVLMSLAVLVVTFFCFWSRGGSKRYKESVPIELLSMTADLSSLEMADIAYLNSLDEGVLGDAVFLYFDYNSIHVVFNDEGVGNSDSKREIVMDWLKTNLIEGRQISNGYEKYNFIFRPDGMQK